MQNILVVDDDTDLLLILKRSLTRYGFNVTTLYEPAMVNKIIEETNPENVILDTNMGDWDGRDICRDLKNNRAFPHIVIILYSALADGEPSLEICRGNHFLQKPSPPNCLQKNWQHSEERKRACFPFPEKYCPCCVKDSVVPFKVFFITRICVACLTSKVILHTV